MRVSGVGGAVTAALSKVHVMRRSLRPKVLRGRQPIGSCLFTYSATGLVHGGEMGSVVAFGGGRSTPGGPKRGYAGQHGGVIYLDYLVREQWSRHIPCA